MLWITAVIIVLYVLSHFLFRNSFIYQKLRIYIDIATLLVTSILVFTWINIFHYSFWFFVYFLLSVSVIYFLIFRLRKMEEKKTKAEKVIRELKNEEVILNSIISKLKKSE